MPSLVAKKYPTILALGAADHTYVECANRGKGWGCFGGKTGGVAFNSGNGSTRRADTIAELNERAGLKCYLINGVCHQAANRILYPAAILVSDARGYGLSSLLYGTYGRPGRYWLNPCYSPFQTHPHITGHLAECAERTRLKVSHQRMSLGERQHLRRIRDAYSRFFSMPRGRVDEFRFNVNLFKREVRHRIGNEGVLRKSYTELITAKEDAETRLSAIGLNLQHSREAELDRIEMVRACNEVVTTFQDDLANAVNASRYKQLVGLDPGERIVLSDPEVVAQLYGRHVASEVFGEEVSRNLGHDS